MSNIDEQKNKIISRIKNGASVKEISNELKISPTEIYSFLRSTIPSDKSIEFDKLPISTQIKLLIIEENYDAALELCNKEENLNNGNVQEQQIKVLLILFEQTHDSELLEKALEICEKNPNMKNINKLKNKIQTCVRDNDINSEATFLLSNLCYGKINKEEIESSTLTSWKKSILLISYYEKYNKQAGLKYIKQIKKEYVDANIKEKIKVLNVLYERLNNKKIKIFDASIYSEYLNCTIDPSYVKKEEKEEPIITKKVIIEKPQVKKQEVNPIKKEKPKQEDIKYSRYNRYNRNNDQIVSNQENIQSKNQVTTQKLIKDVFPQEVLEIGKYLYVEMNNLEKQRDAVKAWDNFECLITKPSNDIEAMKRMIRILKKFQSEGLLPITENYDERKILKKNIIN